MKPKVSIIVPVYNVESYVKDCINSILIQDYDNIEVIIVDDCTPDKSIEIIKDIIRQYDTPIDFKFIKHSTNKGVSAARNTGILASSGDYIMFVDSDDELTSSVCSVLVGKAIETDYDIIVGNRDIINTQTGESLHQPQTRRKDEIEMLNITDYDKYRFQGEVYNKFIRKDFIMKHNLFFTESILYEDTLWVNQIKCYNPKILYIPFVTYIYKIRPDSTMTTYKLTHFRSQVKCAIESYGFAMNLNRPTKWYAFFSSYQFRKAALLYCVTNTSAPVRNFFSLYRMMRKRLPITTQFSTLLMPKMSLVQKIRLYANKFPLILSAPIELSFIYLKAKELKRMNILTGGG